MENKLTYDQAFAELEKIVQQVEHSAIQLDTLAEKVKEADSLILFCENKLRGIEAGVKKIIEKDDATPI